MRGRFPRLPDRNRQGSVRAMSERLPFPAYPWHDSFVTPARPRSEVWRTALGAVVILIVYIASIQLLAGYYSSRYGAFLGGILFNQMALGATPGAMLVLLFSFLGMAAGPVIVVILLHSRTARGLIGPWPGQALSDFLRVTAVLMAFNLAAFFLALMTGDLLRNPELPLGRFLLVLPIGLVGILIQTGAEELVFRGYLQQQLGARFRSPLVWMGVPAALFAMGHYDSGVWGENTFAIMAWTAIFGIFAAGLTARTGHLGAAIGYHFANNVMAMMLTSIRGQMDGLALWVLPIDPASSQTVMMLAVDLMSLIIAWLLARLVLRL